MLLEVDFGDELDVRRPPEDNVNVLGVFLRSEIQRRSTRSIPEYRIPHSGPLLKRSAPEPSRALLGPNSEHWHTPLQLFLPIIKRVGKCRIGNESLSICLASVGLCRYSVGHSVSVGLCRSVG